MRLGINKARDGNEGEVNLIWQEPSSGNKTQVTSGETRIHDGNWHHLMVIFDRPNDYTELWLDGESQGTDTWPTNNPETYWSDFEIGNNPEKTYGTTNAKYDEWRMHSSPVSNPEAWAKTEWKMSPTAGNKLLDWNSATPQ